MTCGDVNTTAGHFIPQTNQVFQATENLIFENYYQKNFYVIFYIVLIIILVYNLSKDMIVFSITF